MFEPSKALLDKYADVMVNCALNSGERIKKNKVVLCVCQLPGLELGKAVYRKILESGCFPIMNILEDDIKKLFIDNASEKQLSFFPKKYYRGLADSIDHSIYIIAEKDPLFLKDSDPNSIVTAQRSMKSYHDWLDHKEDRRKFTWTLCMYGTEGVAQKAELTPEEYWDQIRRACFLDEDDPVQKWIDVFAEIRGIIRRLNAMNIDKLHVTARNTDLWINMGEHRRFLGGSGRNIPSFEIFTSPDWRGTNGHIYFDLPLYRFGNIIQGIYLEFRNGKIVKAAAEKNEALLHTVLKQKNADKIGEFSLTDKRFSKIDRFMAETLFDENHGGAFGNTHIAIGRAYHEAYRGDVQKLKAADFNKLGFNDSVEHTDIIATTDRTVTAILKNGTEKLLYEHGEFSIP